MSNYLLNGRITTSRQRVSEQLLPVLLNPEYPREIIQKSRALPNQELFGKVKRTSGLEDLRLE